MPSTTNRNGSGMYEYATILIGVRETAVDVKVIVIAPVRLIQTCSWA